MLSQDFEVRFYETDALRHVSNTVLAGWFEAAREPIFRIFTPELDLANWPLILASYKIDFLKQIFYGKTVTLKTGISRIGNSSFVVYQEVWQDGQRCASGQTTMVHFDYATQASAAIPDAVRTKLQDLLVEPA
ncbi:acyl-CoA thioesterase [Bowmanella yangjiangensis]|uniref:Acyl-CoA thioesterase n=1 Tax=Bowmanella yangjiangensis TaxID=2811230 RepID=A0ABS3CQ84_9ALTE|nr:thioesterase family protein [Bowmanella yangjiangensis]MBN7819277.1 acyl-CoA thioesterase [Bowmanella yangjiangensis]